MGQKGFTLAELLVSLAVGTILLSVAVPSYSTLMRNARQTASANDLLASLHAARDLAVTQNQRVVMCASSGGSACEAVAWDEGWIVFVDTDGNRQVGGDERISLVGEVSSVAVTSAEFASFLMFRPNGRLMVNNIEQNTGEFTLCDARGSEHARVVVVDVSGRPRVSRTTAGGGEPVCG